MGTPRERSEPPSPSGIRLPRCSLTRSHEARETSNDTGLGCQDDASRTRGKVASWAITPASQCRNYLIDTAGWGGVETPWGGRSHGFFPFVVCAAATRPDLQPTRIH